MAVDFDENDVRIIANALSDTYLEFNSGEYSNNYYSCLCCDGVSPDWAISEKQLKHDLNCPVLIAQDILTPQ